MSKAFPTRNRVTARTSELKSAIVALFHLDCREMVGTLSSFSEADWKSCLWWLDISGMAIYFLDRARQLNAEKAIPGSILEALQRRLDRNRIRIEALRREASTLAGWFAVGGLPYALLKGISLAPESVPDCSLRCQTDLDFMIPWRGANQAVHYVRRLGYRLHALSGNTMELRAGTAGVPDLANIYSINTQRALELHLVPSESSQVILLKRRVSRVFDGATIDTLCPADILVQQSMHLLKHFCGEHTRLSWVLEFHRHVQARSNYAEFWANVQAIAGEESCGNIAMGVALRVAEQMFGKVELEIPQQWQHQALPRRIQLWIERYPCGLLMSDSIGSKLYGLLRNELPLSGEVTKTLKISKLVFPSYLPRPVMQPKVNECFAERLERYAVELDFFLRRLRFHVVEGLRFSAEALRWKLATARCRP